MEAHHLHTGCRTGDVIPTRADVVGGVIGEDARQASQKEGNDKHGAVIL